VIPQSLLQDLLDEKIPTTFQTVLNTLNIPDLGGLTQVFDQLLPKNLIRVNNEGDFSLINPKELQAQLQSGLKSIQDIVEFQVRDVLQEAMALKNQATDAIQQASSAVFDLGAGLTSLNADFINNALGSFNNIAGTLGIDTTSISQIQEAATPVLDGLKNLSPKQIRDLQNPAVLQQTVNTAVDAATQLMGNQAIASAVQSIAPSLNIQAIAQLFGIAGSGIFAVQATDSNNRPSDVVEILAEINTYYAEGEGADIDASQYKSVTGKQLQPGKSCAVDNSSILFDSEVTTSLGTFKAVDKVKSPSTSGDPVISLFFKTQKEAAEKEIELLKTKRKKQVVRVKQPGGTFVAQQLETRGLSDNLI
jgi:hypothetical protein